jgi:alpha-N-acetylglucosamine transferase
MYVAWGKAHVDVARRSAASVKAHNPGLKTAIWCAEDDDSSMFDHAFVIPDSMTRPKIGALKLSPFDETLYLDNDTLVRADLGSLFDLLQRFDLCGAHVMLWHRPRHKRTWRTQVPETFPEINCGVLLYRRSDETTAFFDAWQTAYDAAGMKIDQPTFRETLWNSNLRFYVFPPQFNKRIFEASELIYSDQPKPRILHLPILRPQKNTVKRWFSNMIR